MKNKLICGLLTFGLVSSSMVVLPAEKANAAVKENAVNKTVNTFTIKLDSSAGIGLAESKTAYNWTVHDLGVSAEDSTQIRGPISGGHYNTEGVFGSNRTFVITWSGAPSNAAFFINVVGQDDGNSDLDLNSSTCYGSSGSVKVTVPYSGRGTVDLYVYSRMDEDMNIGRIKVDSR